MMSLRNTTDNVISIFYTRSAWHELITYGIKPIFHQKINDKIIEDYCIYLSTNRGEHINIIIQSDIISDDSQEIVDKLKQFLLINPSPTKEAKYPLNGFFKDYPNNSVHINVDRRFFRTDIQSNYIENGISRTIIDGLSYDEIDANTLYVFLIYVQLSTIKAVFPNLQLAIKQASDLSKYLTNVMQQRHLLNSPEYSKIELSIENNQYILSEIIVDIWNTDHYESELRWLESWIDCCTQYFKNRDFNQAVCNLYVQIHSQLGLNVGEFSLLSYHILLKVFVLLSKDILESQNP